MTSSSLSTFATFTASLVVAAIGCASPSAPSEGDDAESSHNALATGRVFGVVESVFAAADHDGVAGDECAALIAPEHRLRKVLFVEPALADGSCSLTASSAGAFVSFEWSGTAAYGSSTGRAALRTLVGDADAAVHTLVAPVTSEAAARATLEAVLTLSFADQALAIQDPATTTSRRVHSIYDFEGAAEVSAEAAYQAVRVTQPCEQPGSPQLTARSRDGFVYGYVASNSGSCHSGWFSRTHVYNRHWERVATHEYSE